MTPATLPPVGLCVECGALVRVVSYMLPIPEGHDECRGGQVAVRGSSATPADRADPRSIVTKEGAMR